MSWYIPENKIWKFQSSLLTGQRKTNLVKYHPICIIVQYGDFQDINTKDNILKSAMLNFWSIHKNFFLLLLKHLYKIWCNSITSGFLREITVQDECIFRLIMLDYDWLEYTTWSPDS